MLLDIENILLWAEVSRTARCFREGVRVFEAKNLEKVGRNGDRSTDTIISVIGLCLQTSHMRESPHEITGSISIDGDIKTFKCSRAAGKSGKCKHILAVLIHCTKHDMNDFEVLSCTERACQWKKSIHTQVLTQYEAVPLGKHPCLALPIQKFELDPSKIPILEEFAEKRFPESAFAKSLRGRHSPILFDGNVENRVNGEVTRAIEVIYEEQDSEFMKKISLINIAGSSQAYCQKTFNSLAGDYLKISLSTIRWFSVWWEEKRTRITGSTCYQLFTYINNKNPKWEEKCDKHISPANFNNQFTDYGKKMERFAREVFKKVTNKKVFETGLIISKLNPWLAHSPDGVIFDGGKPSELLEVKCQFHGKNHGITDLVNHEIGKSLEKVDGVVCLKRRHKYYAQVQLGMAVLNVPTASYVMYSSFDKSIRIFNILFDECFVEKMLIGLKKMYFSIMLHRICLNDERSDEKVDENNNE